MSTGLDATDEAAVLEVVERAMNYTVRGRSSMPIKLDELGPLLRAYKCSLELAADWEADDARHVTEFGQHLMGGSVLACAEQLRAAIAGDFA